MSKNKNIKLARCALFVALISIGAFIKIPVPMIPFTLQLMFTMLAGLLLGPREGLISVLIYIFLGLAGIPVFAEGGGFFYILKPSFGYIIGFALGAYVTGKIVERKDRPTYMQVLGANLAGMGVVYSIGLLYFYMISTMYLEKAVGIKNLLLYGFLLPLPGDILTCLIAALIGKRLIPVIRRKEC